MVQSYDTSMATTRNSRQIRADDSAPTNAPIQDNCILDIVTGVTHDCQGGVLTSGNLDQDAKFEVEWLE